MSEHTTLRVLGLNCTLKRSPETSSTDVLLDQVMENLSGLGVQGETLRLVDHDIFPGVQSDEGDGDAWPEIRRRILAADILVMATPIWLGQPSSVCKRALERMDAFLGETDVAGRRITADKVAGVAVVGNEDGAHHVTAELYQALNDVGFTIPASATTYWTDEVSQRRNYKDLPETPQTTADSTRSMCVNLAHLAGTLKAMPYPRPA